MTAMGRLTMIGVVVLVALTTCTVALASRGDPKQALTKADQGRAGAMLLRKTDLAAGFAAHPSGNSSGAYCQATDESDLTVTGKAESPAYTLLAPPRFFFVASEVSIYRTVGQALVSWRRNTSPAGEACARSELGDSLSSGAPKLRSFARESFPKVAPLTAAYRFTASLDSAGRAVTLYFDVVALQQGRAQVAVVVASAGGPLARSETLQFARLTAKRMATAMKGA
jgi:hypothetical protein